MHDILARRHERYQGARNAHPARWTSSTRNWTPVGIVVRNGMDRKDMERVKGIEPSYAAWEAAVLPLNYTREGSES